MYNRKFSQAVMSNKNVMEATYVILNFLVDTKTKKKKPNILNLFSFKDILWN